MILFRTSLLSCLLLAGCAAIPATPKDPVRPDPSFLQPCPDPEGSAETNGLMADWLLAYRKALRSCDNQITTFKEPSNGRP